MKLNIGCGTDHKEGYVNVDFRDPCDVLCDIADVPWIWDDESVDEILMFDILEHLPYAKADSVLLEIWRVLKLGAFVDIQVPDFEHCARAAMDVPTYFCNVCGASSETFVFFQLPLQNDKMSCQKCKTSVYKIGRAAVQRLYGGQDYEGNFHYNAFTKELLKTQLMHNGFGKFEDLEKEHMWKNWNFKTRAYKLDSPW